MLINDSLPPTGVTLDAYHKWRSLTVALFGPVQSISTVQCAQEFIKAENERIIDLISPFIAQDKPPKTLHEILEQAMTLSLILRRQRADWYLFFPEIAQNPNSEGCSEFDPHRMKDVEAFGQDEDTSGQDSTSTSQISIFIAPALYKQGNMDGEKYDESYVVEKAEVAILRDHGRKPVRRRATLPPERTDSSHPTAGCECEDGHRPRLLSCAPTRDWKHAE